MLHEALLAAEILSENGFHLKVVNMPWLNRVDAEWLQQTISDCPAVFVLEDHAPVGGLGDRLLRALVQEGLLGSGRVEVIGVEGYPACGTPPEVLRYHGLDGNSLAHRLLGPSSFATSHWSFANDRGPMTKDH
jgi:transketolase